MRLSLESLRIVCRDSKRFAHTMPMHIINRRRLWPFLRLCNVARSFTHSPCIISAIRERNGQEDDVKKGKVNKTWGKLVFTSHRNVFPRSSSLCHFIASAKSRPPPSRSQKARTDHNFIAESSEQHRESRRNWTTTCAGVDSIIIIRSIVTAQRAKAIVLLCFAVLVALHFPFLFQLAGAAKPDMLITHETIDIRHN